MGIEDPNINVGLLKSPAPKPTSYDVKRAPSWVLAVVSMKVSPVTGCSSGSIRTSVQTSYSRLAVRSLILLCLTIGKPPFGYDRTCSTENNFPQSQFAGRCEGSQL